jgi:hypothetical protein
MRSRKNIYIRLIALSITFALSSLAWGQTVKNYYKNDYSSYSIQYKTKTKWHDLRTIKDDTDVKDKFDENETFTVTVDGSYQNIQPSHVLIDTIYVHKGSKYLLSLPDRSENSYSIRSYQRWYNLKTGKTFEVGSDGVTVDTNELVKDLLYPKDYKTQDIEKPARFTNGYVGDPLALTSAMASIPALDMYFYYPKEEQYNKFPKENEKTLVNPDNNEYLIACDVSGYTDYKDGFEIDSEMHFGGSDWKTYTEPTLSHRIIYCIRAIENEKDWRYKFFTDNKNEDKYLEEYEINMPAIRIPDKTQEMVCIATAANAYAVPTNTNDTETLTVNLIDGDGAGSNKSDIQLCDADGNTLTSSTLSGTNRIIHFKYPGNPDTNGTLSVTDGSTATILVTKKVGGKTFRIARFKLTFNKSSVLLTQSQINLIDNPTSTSGAKADASLTEYTYRTPKYLEEHYTCVTDLDFDFPSEIAGKYGQPQVYPYPLGWSESSYGFYDGSAQKREGSGDNVNFMGQGGGRELPQWGYYAILNDYVENGNTTWGLNSSVPTAPTLSKENRKGKDSSYHLYVDASDQPGMIARLTFDHPLCPGSQLFVSAWVKVAQPYNTGMSANSDNAAMLFTIMGVTEGKSGKERDRSYTPIYRYQTGQIPGTYTNGDHPNILGFGDGNDCNQWLHVYFSFTNKSALQTAYDSYVLQIDNNSASTKGGDMYIDDIRVYIASPKVEVKQKSPTCHANNVDALLQMTLDWDRLLSRLGVEEKESSSTTEGIDHVSFCFVDSAKYITRYKALGNNPSEDQLKHAFEESIVKLSYPIQGEDGKTQTDNFYFGKLLFSPYYQDEENKVYDPAKTNTQSNTITTADDAGHFYRLSDSQGKALVADIHCALEPFRTYFLILEENHEDPHEEGGDGSYIPQLERFNYYYNAPLAANSCVAKTSFQLEAQNSIKVNGMLSENSDHTFCNGQIVNFGVQLKAATDDSGEVKPITENVYYDWYLSSLEEFQKEPGSNSVHQALINFRESCPDATTPDEWTPTENQSDKELLTTLVNNNKLILRQATLNTHATDNGDNKFRLVVVPIPLKLGETDKTTIICTDPMEIQLDINGNAPVAHVGFEDVVYPDERADNPDKTYFPTIRASKGIQEACNSENDLLEIPLRNIKLNSAGTSTTSSTTAPSFTINTTYPYLYLIDSNDPMVANKIAEINKTGTFESHTWPVATIKAINAVPNSTSDISKTADQYIRVYFETPTTATLEGMSAPKFREGYWYTLMAYFEESGTSSPSTTATCEGNLTFNLKVVPEYQKWSGPADGSGNWNNDDNWLRSTAGELHKGTNYDDDYTPGETYYGFVPMSFTKVTIPEGKQVQLYKATPNTSTVENGATHSILNLASTDKPATITNPATTHIEYDLMAKEAAANGNKVAYNCETYYTNTVDQIHFEPSTAMPHTELLTYNKAWIDYKLAGRRWYTLASPLQSVVAGDWYTMNTGTQATEYFKDINFTTPNYNRFQPSVYQRGWKQEANMITIGSDGSSNDKTVAVSGNWSGVYNNVAVPYTPGEGFSVKVLNLSTTTTPATDPAVALFRFPKADTEYSYYESENNTSGNQVDVRTSETDKQNVGKLKSDALKSPGSSEFTVTLDENTASKDADYHLIGNPFMAYLDASKFFEVNANLQSKFWMITDGNQTVAVGGTSNNDWITNIGEATRIAPLQSFFVEKKGTSTYTDNTVTFSANMQALAPTGTTASSAALKSSSPLPLLTLVATTADGRQSRAVIAYDRAASEAYKANEDAELFLDSNLSDLPSIYTVAGTMAASINRTSNLWNIPVGTYSNRSGNNGNNPETVTLTFEGLDRFTGTTLYDVEKKTETALHHNSSITIAANTYGRYFLRAGTPTGNEKVETETIRIYTIVRGQLIVTATENLQTVAIYDFAGRLLRYSDTPSGCLFTTHLDKGNYIVRATSEHQQQTSKIQIR